MKLRFTTPLLLATLTLLGNLTSTAIAAPPTVAPSSKPPTVKPVVKPAPVTPAVSPISPPVTPLVPAPVQPAQPTTVSFKCVQAGSGYATIVSSGVKQATLITWNSVSFGPEYTPQIRCNTVSQRFQTMVARNGGKLSNLVLTIGAMNEQTVVCAINQGKYGCNGDNLLFTLNPENEKNPGVVLATLLQIGKYGTGNAVSETAELPEYNLEAVVNEKLANSTDVEPSQPTPNVNPAPVNSGGEGSVF